jgi:hypothetical protein
LVTSQPSAMRGSVISSKFSACQARSKPPSSSGAGTCFQRVRRSFRLKTWSYTSLPNTSSQSRLGGVVAAATSNCLEREAPPLPHPPSNDPANGPATTTVAADLRNDLRVTAGRNPPVGGLSDRSVIPLPAVIRTASSIGPSMAAVVGRVKRKALTRNRRDGDRPDLHQGAISIVSSSR